ncbi:hypothetical protein N431DRAFT_224106 [Stipitochalara longipes BDJ]|nr:hypothetical protein N431DRAFT_224106 [Stipitochalara longipes BDJ]
MSDSNKDIVSPSDTRPARHDAEASATEKGKGNGEADSERVVEYLRQRLATVVAAGITSPTAPDVDYVERSHFSMDLDDESGLEDWSGCGGSENSGSARSETAYPNLRAVSWEDNELDPAWIIDRYCSWQEEDLEDAMLKEGEGSEVNRLLSEEWRGWNEGKEREIGIGEGSGRGRSGGADVTSRDSLTMKRLARVTKTMPVFTLPVRPSRSPSPAPPGASPRSESKHDRMSSSNTLVEVASPATPPIMSPGVLSPRILSGHADVQEPVLTLDLVHDTSFHATTAFLLGPDFGCDVLEMTERFHQGQLSVLENTNSTPFLSSPRPDAPDSSSHPINPDVDSVLKTLETLDISWKVFKSKASVQKYLNTSVPPDEPWDFGICFDRGNGSQHCVVMHARGIKRTYTDHLIVREGTPAGNDVLAPGCKHLFWWCRPHPQWKEANLERRARAKILEGHYEEAKKSIEQFKEKKAGWMKVALQQSYTQLLLDHPERNRTTGKFSIHSMNIILQLAEISELLRFMSEADDWNAELVRRRAKRLGHASIHTCHARYRHAQLLYRMNEFERARDISRENLLALIDFDHTYPLVAKQNILDCAIAMKRRRVDQALKVVEHLWAIETNHPSDLKTKEMALEILYAAHTFKREYVEAEGYKRRHIDMFESGYGKLRQKGQCYYHLAVCLRRQGKFLEGVEASKKAISIYKECLGAADEDLFDATQLLGNCFFDLKDWNKAIFYIDKAVKGYTVALGSKADKTEKARETLKVLEKNAQVKQGLAERLAQQAEKNKKKRKF